MGDRVEPGAKVVAVAESRIGAERGHEGLLEAILGLRRADEADQKPMQLRRVRVDEPLERRKVHAGWNAWRPRWREVSRRRDARSRRSRRGRRARSSARRRIQPIVMPGFCSFVPSGREEVRRSAHVGAAGDVPVVEEAAPGAAVVERRRPGRRRRPSRHSFATSRMTWRRLMQRLSPQKARRRPRSSSSAAAGDCSAAAWTASIGGSIVTGQAWSGALHACQPARGASVAATCPLRLAQRAWGRLVVEQLEREGVVLEAHAILQAQPAARVVEAPHDRVRPRAAEIGPDGERVRGDVHCADASAKGARIGRAPFGGGRRFSRAG